MVFYALIEDQSNMIWARTNLGGVVMAVFGSVCGHVMWYAWGELMEQEVIYILRSCIINIVYHIKYLKHSKKYLNYLISCLLQAIKQ